jgi:hypothetical protein
LQRCALDGIWTPRAVPSLAHLLFRGHVSRRYVAVGRSSDASGPRTPLAYTAQCKICGAGGYATMPSTDRRQPEAEMTASCQAAVKLGSTIGFTTIEARARYEARGGRRVTRYSLGYDRLLEQQRQRHGTRPSRFRLLVLIQSRRQSTPCDSLVACHRLRTLPTYILH